MAATSPLSHSDAVTAITGLWGSNLAISESVTGDGGATEAEGLFGDLGSPKPVAPVAPVFDWTGPYVGAQLGWGWASIVESGDPDIDGDGYVAGVHAGYNYDFGNIVAYQCFTYCWLYEDYEAGEFSSAAPGKPDVTISAERAKAAGCFVGEEGP